MKSLQLKINVCSLAAESKIIRKQVNELKRSRPQKGADPECQSLIRHRRWDLRNESRAAQLLYGFVRGMSYRQIEPKCDKDNYKWMDTFKRLRSKCRKFDIEWTDMERWVTETSVVEVG